MLLYNTHIGVFDMLTKGNVEIGIETRFGPNWPGVRCGARTKDGGECQRPAVKRTGRCTRHSGKSTGPRTKAGRDKIATLHTTHGRFTKEKRQAAKKRAEVGRTVRAEIKQIILCEKNLPNVEEIKEEYLKGLKFHYVKNMREVLDIALTKQRVKEPKTIQ